uniref:K Homology domain-containing protein n=1 Tax=Haptolina brevifila TaxID=156173 RepID=A0A7S2IRA7_9EUKA
MESAQADDTGAQFASGDGMSQQFSGEAAPFSEAGGPPPLASVPVGFDGSKRGRGDEEDGGTKRVRTSMEVEGGSVLKLLVPNNQTGGIIGKQGSVLRQIIEESGARIKISATDEVIPKTGERIATVMGPLPSLLRAQQMISHQLVVTKPGEENPQADAERALKCLIPNHAAGLIIGKAGCIIKELMERSGAQIRVSQPSELIGPTQERIITITGLPGAVDIAQNAICELLADAPASQQPKQIDYSVLKGGPGFGAPAAPFGAPASFYGGGGGGFSAPGAPQVVRAPPMEYASFVATLPPTLPPDEQLQRYQEYLRSYAAGVSQQPQLMHQPMVQHNPQPQHSAGGAGTVSHVLPLPDKIISGIIGKGGSVIREIASRSGAQVRVSQKDQVTAAGERNVMIEGRPEAVAAAQHLISERCREIEAELLRKGIGNGGGGGGAYPSQSPYQQQASYGYAGYSQPQQAQYATQVGAGNYGLAPGMGYAGGATGLSTGLAGAPAPPGYQISNPHGGGY